jgi:hypothetical protein
MNEQLLILAGSSELARSYIRGGLASTIRFLVVSLVVFNPVLYNGLLSFLPLSLICGFELVGKREPSTQGSAGDSGTPRRAIRFVK